MIFDLDGFFCLKGALELCVKLLEFTDKFCHTDIQGLNCTDSDKNIVLSAF